MSQATQQILLLVALFAIFFLFVVRPQQARSRQLAAVRSSLQVGQQVMTTAGLYAEVSSIEGDVVVLELAPGVRARFAIGAVVRRVDQPTTPGADSATSSGADSAANDRTDGRSTA